MLEDLCHVNTFVLSSSALLLSSSFHRQTSRSQTAIEESPVGYSSNISGRTFQTFKTIMPDHTAPTISLASCLLADARGSVPVNTFVLSSPALLLSSSFHWQTSRGHDCNGRNPSAFILQKSQAELCRRNGEKDLQWLKKFDYSRFVIQLPTGARMLLY